VRPDDRQRFIEEVTEALAVAADTKDFAQLQRVLAAGRRRSGCNAGPAMRRRSDASSAGSVARPSISTSCVASQASVGALAARAGRGVPARG
jgi:hypothetical protein